MPHPPDPTPYDALLLVSFGGPEAPDDVMPFLENVTRGRGIPPERLADVAEHYRAFGGVSPINDQNRALLAAIRTDLAANGVDLPVYWGNRNWHPFLADTLREMRADGVGRALAFVTATYASYSGCRQYREDLAAAVAEVGEGTPHVDKIRHGFNHPGFVDTMIATTVEAVRSLAPTAEPAPLVFVTHSIPTAMAASSGPEGGRYVAQHEETARLVAEGVRAVDGVDRPWQLVFCSRSGPPQVPWLEPDVNDHLEAIAGDGAPGAVVVPIGFVSDHMEVRYDLDTEAAETAGRLGLPFARAATAGTDPRFVAMVRDLVLERAAVERGLAAAAATTPGVDRVVDRVVPRACVGRYGPSHDVCPAGCCPNLRGARPALAGADTDAAQAAAGSHR